MGQKVNQNIYRLSNSYLESSWVGSKKKYLDVVYQDMEIKKYLSKVLYKGGIISYGICIIRKEDSIRLLLDLYFCFWLSKKSKIRSSKRLVRGLKTKYKKLSKGTNIRYFYKFFVNYGYIKNSGKRKYYVFKKGGNFVYLKSFRYFLKGRKDYNQKVLSCNKSVSVGVSKPWLNRLWAPRRVSVSKVIEKALPKKCISRWGLGPSFKKKPTVKVCSSSLGKKSLNFYGLSKELVLPIQELLGVEKVSLSFSSSQLLYQPMLKLFKRKGLVGLYSLARKEEFNEIVELVYFILVRWSKKNSILLVKLLVHLLESNRKQTLMFYLVTKVISGLLLNLPKEALSVSGIRIIVKGRFNKRRRSKKIIYHRGSVSTSKIDQSLSYYQDKAVTLYGSFGVKVWLVGKYSSKGS